MKKFIILFFIISNLTYSQTDLEKILQGGSIIINGLQFLKQNKTNNENPNSKIIKTICIKNKMLNKITFTMQNKDLEGEIIKKEMVIQKDSKEFVFDIPKGVYAYEIILENKNTFKKGEYKFVEETTIIVKDE